jgi:ribosome-binding factor A
VSFDGSEPMHVHVRKDELNAKVWMSPLRFAWSEFKSHEESEILKIIVAHQRLIESKWNEHFNK